MNDEETYTYGEENYSEYTGTDDSYDETGTSEVFSDLTGDSASYTDDFSYHESARPHREAQEEQRRHGHHHHDHGRGMGDVIVDESERPHRRRQQEDPASTKATNNRIAKASATDQRDKATPNITDLLTAAKVTEKKRVFSF